MMKFWINLLILSFSLSAFGQHDPKAKEILSRFSAKSKSYSAIKADFSISNINLQNKKKSHQQGSIILKGNKYKLNLMGSEVISDGRTVWNYLPESNEVNISKAGSQKDESVLNNPSRLFRIYDKEYKYKFLREFTEGGKVLYEIDLFPFDLKKSYSRVRLQIEKESLELHSAKVFLKDGNQTTISISKFVPDFKVSSTDFTFDKKKHPKVEVNDMRF
ncbi:MAG: outer membrane lipoprotein carrier protein LolA [Bacteroidota bacterium]|nr:outer membrane lipoprotein carrier protein LolA [Bacteroidota bacterium]MDP4226664.1 outer membrane lipoprotein carrier protein LolA [Bacteroidota bacterium]MDP4273231.1 outer membrane lipoprotein carrier protein LolA [Bacteroidota bacterium]